MKKISLLFCVLAYGCAAAVAQIPAFTAKQVKVGVPAFLPGIMPDSSAATLQNDTLYYTLQGQVFGKGTRISLNNHFASPRTPWQTIFEMADAYAKKDKQRIIALYETGSQAKIKALLSGANGTQFLNFVSRASKSNLRLLAGFAYKNGWIVYTKDDAYGLHDNYIIQQDGRYKLAALDDNMAESWNLSLYYKFEPAPFVPVKNVRLPDSLAYSDSIIVVINTPAASKHWVAIIGDKPGEQVYRLIEDNGVNDLDRQPQKISFYLGGLNFRDKGFHKFYIISLNYPVQRVSSNFFTPSQNQIQVY
ncbi:MAG TPA: hypothetical protein VG738_13580 [Chitinophagaceae bacterium]|nr:hypothetical protein [Chitinophagaceae bacterium]